MLSMDPEHLADLAEPHRTRAGSDSAGTRIWLPFLGHLFLHLAGYSFSLVTLGLYFAVGELKFFFPLLIVFLVSGAFSAFAAGKELPEKPWWQLFLLYGLLQWIQVKHMFDAKARRSIPDFYLPSLETPPPYNSKTFDGILPGMVFAVANSFAYYLVNSGSPTCPWHLRRELNNLCDHCSHLRWVFLMSAFLSGLSVALGVMEVDYRISETVYRTVNKSIVGATRHYLYRAAEVTFRVAQINIVCLFLRGQAFMQSSWGPYALYLPIFIIWIIYYCILVTSRKDPCLASLLVAISVIVVNPFQFVQIAGYTSEVKTINQRILSMRIAEMVAFAIYICVVFNDELPKDCSCDKPPCYSLGETIMFGRSGLAFIAMLLSALVFAFIMISTDYIRTSFLTSQEIPAAELLSRASFQLRIQDGVRGCYSRLPRGLFSLLIQVGIGITSTLFHEQERIDEREFQDFTIEGVLGKGSYGVVVKVCSRNQNQKDYAMKLLNTRWDARPDASPLARLTDRLFISNNNGPDPNFRSSEVMAERECAILEKLRNLNHKFVVRLEWYFDVPPGAIMESLEQHWSFGTSDVDLRTTLVRDKLQNSCFHKALVMELCESNLQEYLVRHSIRIDADRANNYVYQRESLAFDFNMFITMRRFSAEVLEAVSFLHRHKIIWRDMKPDNILLKRWSEEDSLFHICITDFGFAKDVSDPTDPAQSLAGNPFYLAPEVDAIRKGGGRRRYTEAVDIYSLGKLILVLLWHEMLPTNKQFRLPHDVFQCTDLRVPPCVQELTKKMTDKNPEARGSAEEHKRAAFFRAFELRDSSGQKRSVGCYEFPNIEA